MLETLPLGSQVQIKAWNFVSEPDGIGYSGAYEDYAFDGVVTRIFDIETVEVQTYHSGAKKPMLFHRHKYSTEDDKAIWTWNNCKDYEDARITQVQLPHTPEIICVSYPVADLDEVDIYIGPEEINFNA